MINIRNKETCFRQVSRQCNRNREASVIFSSLQTSLERAQILPGKFAMNFHEGRIVTWKIAANYSALWNITRKIGPVQTIGAAKMRRTIAIYRGNNAWSENSLKSSEKPGISTKFVCITFAQYCIERHAKRTFWCSLNHVLAVGKWAKCCSQQILKLCEWERLYFQV